MKPTSNFEKLNGRSNFSQPPGKPKSVKNIRLLIKWMKFQKIKSKSGSVGSNVKPIESHYNDTEFYGKINRNLIMR